jgi:hypothetical protein
MTITADLDHFAAGHRPHGRLTAETGALTPNGYRLRVACPCGVTFERWITLTPPRTKGWEKTSSPKIFLPGRSPMRFKAPWLKPAVWGVIVGSVATMIVGFSWLGWVLGSTAERMAHERTNAAVVRALTPGCVERFMAQPDAPGKLKELQTIDSWKQREFVEAGGWATPRGATAPNSELATSCTEQLLKEKGA